MTGPGGGGGLESVSAQLRRRLAWKRQARESALDRCSLDAALEAIPAAAFLVAEDASLRQTNELGRSIFEREAPAVRAALAGDLRDPSRRFEVTTIASRGSADHYLVVMRAPLVDPAPRLSKAASRWSLTPRQTEVLSLLIRGWANKTIAASLECSERTVEIHVTSLFDKTGCESRSEIVARFWTSI